MQSPPSPRSLLTRLDPGAVAAWALGAAPIIYLGLKNGGFDPDPRGAVGLVVWWILLLAAAVGLLPSFRGIRAAAAPLALLIALAVWTGLAAGWSESDERTVIELARVVTYVGVFALALVAVAAGRWRELLAGVTAGIGVIVVLAALSRMLPSWFPEPIVGDFNPDLELERRLAYPLGYSSGLATLTAIGMALLVHTAGSAGRALTRGLAVAALSAAFLTLWLTGSSLAIPLVLIGLGVYFAFSPERIAGLFPLVLAAIAGAVLVAVANGLDAVDRGLVTDEAISQGRELLVFTIAATALVVAAHLLLEARVRALAERLPTISRRAVIIGAGAAAALLLVAFVAAGGPGRAGDEWDAFKDPDGLGAEEASRGAQIVDVSSRGRYEYWQAAVNAFDTEPLKGIGPGTYEFYWAQNGTGGGAIFIRDAHSLYLETAAELGVPGLVLIVAFIVLVLALGTIGACRLAREVRAGIAAAVAGCWVFAAAAAVDWVWELAAVAAALFLLAAVAVAGGREPLAASAPAAQRPGIWPRLAIVALALVAIAAVAIPLAGSSSVDRSRTAVAEGRLDDALDAADDAISIQPYAATPRLQAALVLERLGRFDEAASVAAGATERESTNWRTWFILSRLEARAGNAKGAVDAYRRAEMLFPRLIQPAAEE